MLRRPHKDTAREAASAHTIRGWPPPLPPPPLPRATAADGVLFRLMTLPGRLAGSVARSRLRGAPVLRCEVNGNGTWRQRKKRGEGGIAIRGGSCSTSYVHG